MTDTIYIVAELYASGMTPETMTHRIRQIDFSLPIDIGGEVIDNDCPLDGIIDSAAFSDNGQGSRGDEMNKLGCRWKPSEKGWNSRLAGISAIHQRLATRPDGTVGLRIFKTCKNLIKTLPALCYSKTRPDDVDTEAEDHCYDCLRYGLTRKVFWTRRVRVKGL